VAPPQCVWTTKGGLWTALDAATGKIVWQTADPQGSQYITDGFVSSANGVVYAGSSGGNFYALGTRTGQIKWTFPSGGAVWSGAAIVNGTVYWGSGYDTLARGMHYNGNNDKFYAFALNGPSKQRFVPGGFFAPGTGSFPPPRIQHHRMSRQ
jgi:polyvinyl alcohol dehydrogenase (cytochrome)